MTTGVAGGHDYVLKVDNALAWNPISSLSGQCHQRGLN